MSHDRVMVLVEFVVHQDHALAQPGSPFAQRSRSREWQPVALYPREATQPGGASLTNDIRRVAVLGAGTMGAAIAAHAANAGLAVDLLDQSPEVVQAGFERMLAARPAALASRRLAYIRL